MRLAIELRKEKDISKVASDEAKKYKASVDMYKDEFDRAKKDLKNKDNKLTKSTKRYKRLRRTWKLQKSKSWICKPSYKSIKTWKLRPGLPETGPCKTNRLW